MKYGNIIYFGSLNTIGGIETWLYNLSVLHKEKDILVLIKAGNNKQVERLRKNVQVRFWKGENYECEKLFVCFNREIIGHVKADRTYLVLHGDYKDMVNRKQLSKENLPVHPSVDEYIGVSKQVCSSWEELTGHKATLSYNPVLKPTNTRVVRLMSAQRMSREKGLDRIIALSKALDRYCETHDTAYIWDIYTDSAKNVASKNVYFRPPRLDIQKYIKAYDYFVSLSDNEGYCYSVVESLMNCVPCIVTDIPVFEELGLNETNSIKLDLKLGNIKYVTSEIFRKQFSFDYEPPKDNWGSIFSNKASTYEFEEEENTMKHTVIALDTYQKLKIQDSVEGRIMLEGEEFEVEDDRLDVLLGKNPWKTPFIKVAEKPKKIDPPVVDKNAEIDMMAESEIKEPVKKRGRKKK